MKHGNFIIGFMLGAVLFTGTTAYAAGIIAEKSTQKIIVDGSEVQMEAYAINGHNYVKLRDIGEQVGFNVYWDGSVQIESDKPYTGVSPVEPSAAVHCADGTDYIITDESRRDHSTFAEGPLGDLPTPTCDWSKFPALEVKEETRHFTNANEEILFKKNVTETKRMIYTLYNLIGADSDVWNNGKPLATVDTTIESEFGVRSFWPWRESEIVKLFESRPLSHYSVEAWDYYSNGVFQYTRYLIRSL